MRLEIAAMSGRRQQVLASTVARVEQEVVDIVDVNDCNATTRAERLAEVECAEQELKARMASVAVAAAGSAAQADQVRLPPSVEFLRTAELFRISGKHEVASANTVRCQRAVADGLRCASDPSVNVVGSSLSSPTSRDCLYVVSERARHRSRLLTRPHR